MNIDKVRKLFKVEDPGPYAFIDTGFPMWVEGEPDWESHLAGTKSLCVTPIGYNNTCYWGALDIDSKGDAPAVDYDAVQHFIFQHNLPLNLFKSRSGRGAHTYLFSPMAVPAVDMVGTLRLYSVILSHLLDTANGVEIFPKQTELEEGDNGSCIRPPYFGDKCQPVFMGDPKVERIVAIPPCLDSLPEEGDRNNFIYHITNFMVLSGLTNVKPIVVKVNNSMDDPLDEKEVERTVASAQRNRNRNGAGFGLGCKSCPESKKSKCKFSSQLRQKEVMGSMVVEIVHYLAEDPKIRVAVDGKSLIFEVDDVFNNHKVRMDFLTKHRTPAVPLMKKSDWNNALHEMLETADHVDELTHRDKGHFILQQLRKWAKDFKPGISSMYSGTPVFISKEEILIFPHDVFNRFNTIGIQGISREDINTTLESIGKSVVINGSPAIKVPAETMGTAAVGLEIPIISDIDPEEVTVVAGEDGVVTYRNKDGVQIELTNSYIKEHKLIQQKIYQATVTDVKINF